MKDSIRHKLDSLRERFEELEGLLAEPDVINDPTLTLKSAQWARKKCRT